MPPGKRRAGEEARGSPPARRRRSGSNASDESFGRGPTGTGSGAVTPTVAKETLGGRDAMVKKLVRLALSSEVARRPIRRQDISDKVLDGRNFKTVFEETNRRLRSVFGMELTELPAKERITMAEKRAAQRSATNSNYNTNSHTQGDGGGSGGGQDRAGSGNTAAAGAGSGSKVWILTSVLPGEYRNATILPPSGTPSAKSEAEYSGFVAFVVTTIMISNNQRLSQGKLDAYLRQVNALEYVLAEKTEKLLKRMEREGFIRKVKETDGGEELVDYVVGPRGKIEIGGAGAAGLVRSVYGYEGDELEQLNAALERSLGSTITSTGAVNAHTSNENGIDNEGA